MDVDRCLSVYDHILSPYLPHLPTQYGHRFLGKHTFVRFKAKWSSQTSLSSPNIQQKVDCRPSFSKKGKVGGPAVRRGSRVSGFPWDIFCQLYVLFDCDCSEI